MREERVDVSKLNVGDKVLYARYVNYGWNRTFRYPLVTECTVTRITPKRTKVVLNDSIDVDHKNFSRLLVVNEETLQHHKVTQVFENIRKVKYHFDEMYRQGKFYLADFSDEDLLKLNSFLMELYDKSLKKEK